MARAVLATTHAELDLLELLPRRSPQEFSRGAVIYSPHQPCTNLYMVVSGRVKVSTTPEECETVCRLVFKGNLFGEPALVPGANGTDTAVTLNAASLMSWTAGEIEKQVALNPRLGIVLCQYLVRHCLDLTERMESLVVYKTSERLMLALAEFARRNGVEMSDGTTRVEALTHQTLGEFVGTSREVVTFQLNRLRSLGLIRYSRQYIDISVAKVEAALRRGAAQASSPSGM